VPAFTLNNEAHAGRCSDAGHETDHDACLFEKRTLLNVQFDKGGVGTGGQANA